MGCSRSGWYRETTDPERKDSPVMDLLNEAVERHGRWGFWKCFRWMRQKRGVRWNHKRVRRVYRSMRLNRPKRTPKG
jgi:putative transposase